MNSFKMGKDEFGIGHHECEIKDGKLYLKIYGDKKVFNDLCEDEDSEWGWALEAPYLYMQGVPIQKNKKLKLKESLLDICDFAVYMMEHNEITGTIVVTDQVFELDGTVDIMGDVYPICVHMDL